MELKEVEVEWGIKFFKQYVPEVVVPEDVLEQANQVELRVEISPPRIKEHDTHHYFKFSLDDYEKKDILFHNNSDVVRVKVPPLEHMTAVKLGLPVDFKHNFDAAMLLNISDIGKVAQIIKENDDWSLLVLRRMPKLKGRISQKDSLEHMLARNANLDIKMHLKKLNQIERLLIE